MISYQIVARSPLLLRPGDAAGPHISAASGVAWLGDSLIVIDDASTFAGVFPQGHPPGDGLRLFPPIQGIDRFTKQTKALKPDLEVLVPLPDGTLLGLASGTRHEGTHSRQARSRGVRISSGMDVEILELGALYAALAERQEAFNLEGALALGEDLLLFLRGNGARPMTVTLYRWQDMIHGKISLGPSEEVSLPLLGGVSLGFTDACLLPDGHQLAALAAEDTPNPYEDGGVSGSVLYDLAQRVVLPIYEPDGSRFMGKLEGICPSGAHLLGVTDPDDPEQPGELLWLTEQKSSFP